MVLTPDWVELLSCMFYTSGRIAVLRAPIAITNYIARDVHWGRDLPAAQTISLSLHLNLAALHH